VIDPALNRYLDKEQDSEIDSIIVEGPHPDWQTIESASTKRERLNLLQEHNKRFMSRLTEQLRGYHVTLLPLPATGQIIITAPVSKLKELVRQGGELDTDPNIKVIPNMPFFPIQSAS
jgi:hypothetical protein